jgi:ParB-like chromosome segregation protein Spo0J
MPGGSPREPGRPEVRLEWVRIDRIKVGPRLRKAVGNLTPIIDAIREVRFVDPIVLTQDYKLIYGYRRIEAHKQAGCQEILAVIWTLPK